jgi:hypothetical protein
MVVVVKSVKIYSIKEKNRRWGKIMFLPPTPVFCSDPFIVDAAPPQNVRISSIIGLQRGVAERISRFFRTNRNLSINELININVAG